nr:MAG TPA: hypothetical protein [Bacteriophage sp.]
MIYMVVIPTLLMMLTTPRSYKILTGAAVMIITILLTISRMLIFKSFWRMQKYCMSRKKSLYNRVK